MSTTQQLNCGCCTVDCVANGGVGRIKRRLNVKVYTAGGSCATLNTFPPGGAVFNNSNNNWTWAAGTLPNRYPINGGGASLGDGINTIDQTDLLCFGSIWSNAHCDIAVWSSGGLYTLGGPANSFTVIDPGPGTFHISFSFFMGALGLTWCSGFLNVDFYE